MARIAVVDDVAVNRELFSFILRQFGHSISEAADGASALELVRRERPDLIICDILMPQVDGYEFVRRLRADPATADIPVVFCTAYFLEPEAQQLAEACGVREVLTKPVDPQEIIDVVQRVLERGADTAAAAPLAGDDFDHEHLQLISAKLAEKVAELQAAHDKLAALVELNLQLASERNKGGLLAHVCAGARQLLGAELGTVAVREADSETLAHVKHCGIEPAMMTAMDAIQLDRGALGRVYRDAQVLRLGAEAAAEVGLPRGYPPLRDVLVAPVKSLSATYGWILLGNKQELGGFTEADAELLRILAAQAGRIYENGSLYAKLHRYAQELETGIVERERARRHLAAQYAVGRILNGAANLAEATQRLLDAICRELGFGAATLWRVDEFEQRLRCVDAWCQPDELCAAFVAQSRGLALAQDMGIPGRAWASGKPQWAADLALDATMLRREAAAAAGLLSGGALPIVVGGQVIGVIDVFTRERCEFDPRLADTLATLAVQIGQFFERTRQQQRIVRLTRVYAVLSGINSAIVRIHDRPKLFREACRIAVREGEFGIAWIGEIDPETREVVPVAWAGVDDDIGADRLSIRSDVAIGQGAVGEAVRRGAACVVNDLGTRDAVGRRREEALRRGYRSLIALPLIVDARVVGVMVLYACEAEFFTAEEQTLLTELANDVSFALEYIAKQDLLAYLAYHDVLTDLPNRAHLLDRLGMALQMVRHHPGDRVGVVLWDVNRFRNINDTFGRQVGDGVLRELARRFRSVWPDETNFARLSVDHFAGVFSGDYEPTDIAHLIEKTVAAVLGQPFIIGDHELRIALSAGIAVAGDAGDDADALVRNAEAALRKAKSSGVGYLFYGPEMNALIAETMILENKLRRALERDEFVLHYQPKVCGATGCVTGLEALLRWNDPVNGLVPPGRFIPILEETGMIVQVGLDVVRRALADARQWRAAGVEPPRIAVNVSPMQLRQTGFVESLQQVLAEAGDEPPVLDLEITESMIMSDLEANAARLAQIRRMGMEIAIDDFGTGYSSLGYLAKLPVSALKIDQSFVATMTATPESMTIVSTIISLAHSLNLKVIAEGVEEEDQARLLRLFKCNELQGYLISRPLPPEQIVDFVRARGSL